MLVGLPNVMLQVLHPVRVLQRSFSLDSLVKNETHIPTSFSYFLFKRAILVSVGRAVYTDLEGGLNRQAVKIPRLG